MRDARYRFVGTTNLFVADVLFVFTPPGCAPINPQPAEKQTNATRVMRDARRRMGSSRRAR